MALLPDGTYDKPRTRLGDAAADLKEAEARRAFYGYVKGGPVTYKNSHPHADAYSKSMDSNILAKGRYGR